MNDDPKGFYKAKIATGTFFLNKVLPETGALMSSIMSGASSYTKYEDDFFESSFSQVARFNNYVIKNNCFNLIEDYLSDAAKLNF